MSGVNDVIHVYIPQHRDTVTPPLSPSNHHLRPTPHVSHPPSTAATDDRYPLRLQTAMDMTSTPILADAFRRCTHRDGLGEFSVRRVSLRIALH